MAIDAAQMQAPPEQGKLLTKRNLLIGALVIGGVAGLIILLSRQRSPSATPENGADQTALAVGSLATQLLQFRGEQSIANADAVAAVNALGATTKAGFDASATQLTDIGTGQNDLETLLNTLFGNLSTQVGGVGSQVAGVSGQITDVGNQVGTAAVSIGAQNQSALSQLLALFGIISQQVEDTRMTVREEGGKGVRAQLVLAGINPDQWTGISPEQSQPIYHLMENGPFRAV